MYMCWNIFEDFVQKRQAEHSSPSDSSLLVTSFSDDYSEVSVLVTILWSFVDVFQQSVSLSWRRAEAGSRHHHQLTL